MFRIRVFTAAVHDHTGWRHAGVQLEMGDGSRCFLLDLSAWDIPDYERQWQHGLERMTHGAPSTALMSAYRGAAGAPHVMWALWKDETHVYVQEHCVFPAELDSAFDPSDPYPHVGERIAATEHRLSIPEWRFDLGDLFAASVRIHRPR
jgi:hypothetical protein